MEAPYKDTNALNYESERLLRAMHAHDWLSPLQAKQQQVALREDGEAQGGEVPLVAGDAGCIPGVQRFSFFLFKNGLQLLSFTPNVTIPLKASSHPFTRQIFIKLTQANHHQAAAEFAWGLATFAIMGPTSSTQNIKTFYFTITMV